MVMIYIYKVVTSFATLKQNGAVNLGFKSVYFVFFIWVVSCNLSLKHIPLFQSVMPYFVATKLSKIRKASLTVPNPDTYVRSALATIGLESRTNGYWVHDLLVNIQVYYLFLLTELTL